jgi:hypothetical protein
LAGRDHFGGSGSVLAISEHHVHARGGKRFDNRAANPTASSSDNGDSFRQAGIKEAWAVHPEIQ